MLYSFILTVGGLLGISKYKKEVEDERGGRYDEWTPHVYLLAYVFGSVVVSIIAFVLVVIIASTFGESILSETREIEEMHEKEGVYLEEAIRGHKYVLTEDKGAVKEHIYGDVYVNVGDYEEPYVEVYTKGFRNKWVNLVIPHFKGNYEYAFHIPEGSYQTMK